MAPPLNLGELLDLARGAEGPQLVAKGSIKLGGVDPLGLRQINFNMMDEVLPDLNNVAAHIRPYVFMAWTWRRVRQILERNPRHKVTDEQMRDFADRMEAIFAWSQFLVMERPDLPGRVAMGPLLEGKSYRFGGERWEERRDMRRYSTGLISPLNYGPSLRTMGWLIPVEGAAGVFQPPLELDPALDAFEKLFAHELSHDAFNKFGAVTVKRDDAQRWGSLWDLYKPRRKERDAAFDRLGGILADRKRQDGIALIRAAYRDLDDDEAGTAEIRGRMADAPQQWASRQAMPAAAADWRAVQVRQAHRLALEALFHWTISQLRGAPLRSATLAKRFIDGLADDVPTTAREWLSGARDSENPVAHIDALQSALRDLSALPEAILAALRHVLHEAPQEPRTFERRDRLPLSRARDEAVGWFDLSPLEFMVKVIEVWVIAQHTYWCVTRGLADARNGGKTILRMRIVMDEGGWTLTPQTTLGNRPEVTPDRLDTAIELLRECRRLDWSSNG